MQPRFDLYANVHKALRKGMSDVLFELGRLDLTDAVAVDTTLGHLDELLSGLALHLTIENQFVHRALVARRPCSIVSDLERDHEDHERTLAVLRDDLDALRAAQKETHQVRAGRARQLYLAMTRFIAENFLHMAIEEERMNAQLWEAFSDQELMEIQRAIIAHESPEQIAQSLRYMLPAIAPVERAHLLFGASIAMPPEAFAGILRIAQSALSEAEYTRLTAMLAEHAATAATTGHNERPAA